MFRDRLVNAPPRQRNTTADMASRTLCSGFERVPSTIRPRKLPVSARGYPWVSPQRGCASQRALIATAREGRCLIWSQTKSNSETEGGTAFAFVVCCGSPSLSTTVLVIVNMWSAVEEPIDRSICGASNVLAAGRTRLLRTTVGK